MQNRRMLLASVILAVAIQSTGTSSAQTYPSRPITIVVPFGAGGGNDVVARIMAGHMRQTLGQPVIVENVTGAAGSLAVGRVARAASDGYTLISGGWGTHVANGAIYSLSYDLQKDFAPVSLLPSEPLILISNNSMPAHDLKSLIAWVRANPDKTSEGTTGVGSPEHIVGILLQKEIGTNFQFVPYRGAGQAIQDLIAGHTTLMMPVAAAALQQVRGGTVRAYAVTSESRSKAVPDIPTMEEAGLPGFRFTNWRALWVPTGTPKDAIAKLNAAVADALADPIVQQRLSELGQQIPAREQLTPEALAAFHKAEIYKWWPIIKAAKITAE